MTDSIRFYNDLIPSVLSGKKTITIRRQSRCCYRPGRRFRMLRHSDGVQVGELEVLSVKDIRYQDLNDRHAAQENMTLSDLRKLIQKIYPGIEHLTVISFKLIR